MLIVFSTKCAKKFKIQPTFQDCKIFSLKVIYEIVLYYITWNVLIPNCSEKHSCLKYYLDEVSYCIKLPKQLLRLKNKITAMYYCWIDFPTLPKQIQRNSKLCALLIRFYLMFLKMCFLYTKYASHYNCSVCIFTKNIEIFKNYFRIFSVLNAV